MSDTTSVPAAGSMEAGHPAATPAVDPAEKRRVMRGGKIVVVVVVLLLVLGTGRTIFSRIANAKALDSSSTEHAVQYVKTTVAKTTSAGQTVSLPGSLQGFQQSPIAARSSGYVKRWTKDIGAHVEKGELLAEIESPEIDQQLSQAVAARNQTAASLGLAKSTAERWEALRKKDVVSQQELDERRSGVAQAEANVAAADANVQRLRQLQGFTKITAPFSGVITRRNVDVGDLIDSGGRTLFVLTQMDPLRVYVNVPQSYANLVRPGQKVVVTQSELRGQTFDGEVARTAGSIDAATRTMQVEITLPNKQGVLLPGAYVQVSLPLAANATMVVPTNVLLFRGEGTRVATVDAANHVRLKPITLGRNLGESIEVLDGITNPRPARGQSFGLAGRRRCRDRRHRRCGRRRVCSRGRRRRRCQCRDRREDDAVMVLRGRAGASLCLVGFLSACAVGPDYVRPVVETPPAWTLDGPWRTGAPADTAPKGPWWQRFGDARLDRLQQQALAQSPNLTIAVARLEQARAFVRVNEAALYPNASAGLRAARSRISADRPLSNYAVPSLATVQNDVLPSLSVGYEIDIAGRIRRTVESAQANADQSAADLENVRLLLGTDLANAYFNMRESDIELDVLARSIALQRRSLDFVSTRHDLGASSGLDVAQQQALLDTTLTQVDVLRRQRSSYEHAVATLTGTPAPSFSLGAEIAELTPPPVPLGVPSDVLQRRPDVASAERAMASANAQVGVAKAAYYPSILLAPSIGFESNQLASLFDAPSRIWSLGASITQLFSGGRITANVDAAKANYDAVVGNYRRVVLTAMQEVEDGITGLSALERADAQAHTASVTARHVLDLANARYEGRRDDVSRRHHGAAIAAHCRAALGPARWPAPAHGRVPHQGAGRRLAGSASPDRFG